MIEPGGSPITLINIIIGIIVLTLGRNLFWLFVGCIGFAVGFNYAPYLWNLQSGLLLIGLAAFTGIIGAVLAVFFQKIMVGLAGFAGGGYIALNLINLLYNRADERKIEILMLDLKFIISAISIRLFTNLSDWNLDQNREGIRWV